MAKGFQHFMKPVGILRGECLFSKWLVHGWVFLQWLGIIDASGEVCC